MIEGKRILGVIPARGGSKGVPRKNIRSVGGKPLIAWTILAARASRYLDRFILSSEDPEIIELAKSLGCEVPFKRPLELSADETPGVDPVLHALEQVPGYDYVVLLQVTSPLRLASDIDTCIEECVLHAAPASISMVECAKSPYWMYRRNEVGTLHPFMDISKQLTRRQDAPKLYAPNGAVYVASVEYLKQARAFMGEQTRAYLMPEERSLDIDTEFDMRLATSLLHSD